MTMEKLTVELLNTKYNFNYVPNSHNLMSDGKGCIIDVYGKPFKINGEPVVTIEDLESKLSPKVEEKKRKSNKD